MTVYGSSTFTAANQSGWISSDGQTWNLVRGNQTLSISSNEGLMTYNGSTTAGVVQLGSKLVGDGEYLVRCSQSGNVLDEMGICVRFTSTTTHYKFTQGTTSGTFSFIKDVSGAFTTIATASFTSTVGSFYWIRARVIGTSFWGKIWADGSAEPQTWNIGALGVTDSSIAGPQGFGLVSAPRSGDHVSFDSFYAFDYINSEDLSVTDSFLGSEDTTPGFVEALSASDSFLAQGTFNPVDGLSASDSFLAQGSANLTDIIPVSDSFQAGGIYQPVDALSASDSFQATSQILPVEGLSVLDSFLAQSGASWIEIIPVSESFLASGQFLPTDNLLISDAFFSTGLFVPVEALSAQDVFLAIETALFVDALTITDSFSGSSTAPPVVSKVPITWLTRDGTITWKTRDGNVTWLTRDGNVTWRTRG